MAKAKQAKRAPRKTAALCPLTQQPRLRLASDAQTDTIKAAFPAGVSRPALRALYAAGIHRLQQLTTFREEEVAALHGMGPKALGLLKSVLAEQGLRFK